MAKLTAREVWQKRVFDRSFELQTDNTTKELRLRAHAIGIRQPTHNKQLAKQYYADQLASFELQDYKPTNR